MSKTEDKPFKNKILITSKLEYVFRILLVLFVVVMATILNYANYTANGFNILFFCISLFIFGFIYFLFYIILNEDISIELDDKRLFIKRPFNRGISLKYDEVSDVNISFSKAHSAVRNPTEHIIINRRTNKPIMIITKPSRIDLKPDRKNFDKKSNFIECINFLSTKTSVTIYIDKFYKYSINESIIDAKIEWSK